MQSKLSFWLIHFLFVASCSLFFQTTNTIAQETQIFVNDAELFSQAQEHYDMGNYALAQQKFVSFLQSTAFNEKRDAHTKRMTAHFYEAMCTYKLGHPNVETLFVDFIANYEDGGYFRNMANYYLGQMYFTST